MSLLDELAEIRYTNPDAIEAALRDRRPGRYPADGRRVLVVAADHPARGALAVGDNPLAMASREELLLRCQTALAHPRVTGFLGTPDLVEDLALLGAIEDKFVLGSMNRSGLHGGAYETDDRMTAYDAAGIRNSGLDGGKVLVRIGLADQATPPMLERAARAVDELAALRKTALIEPFMSIHQDGRWMNDLSTEAVIRSIAIASGLGRTSARTWLKVPCVEQMERVSRATTLPILLLGGDVGKDPGATVDKWAAALQLPNVKGLVFGRALLFPSDGDVTSAIDKLTEVM